MWVIEIDESYIPFWVCLKLWGCDKVKLGKKILRDDRMLLDAIGIFFGWYDGI